MPAFRCYPYYLHQEPAAQCKASSYSYPFSIGDEVYELYAGEIYPLKVVGFYITEQCEYAVVMDTRRGMHEIRIALQNIFLSRENAQAELERSRR